MRQLFVPACVCLMIWSGPAGSDIKHSLEPFTGNAEKKVIAAAPTTDSQTTVIEKTSAEAIAPERTASLSAPIDIPPQRDIDESLQTDAGAPIPLPPVKKPVVERSHREICDTLAYAAQSNDLPAPFFIRLLFQESRFQPGVVSPAGAEGIAQFMPETSADVGLDNPFDPLQAIPASARLLRNLFEQFGNLGLAAAAYNAGPRRIQNWLAKKAKLPQETQGYVKTITGRPAETWMVASAGGAEMRLPRRAPCQDAAGLHAWNGPEHIPLPPTRTPAHTMVAQQQQPAARERHKPAKMRVAEINIARKEPHKDTTGGKADDASKDTGKGAVKAEAKDTAKAASRSAHTLPAQPAVKSKTAGKASLQLAARQKKNTPLALH